MPEMILQHLILTSIQRIIPIPQRYYHGLPQWQKEDLYLGMSDSEACTDSTTSCLQNEMHKETKQLCVNKQSLPGAVSHLILPSSEFCMLRMFMRF